MRELSAPVAGCRTRFVSYWSDLDQMIFPQRNAKMKHPDLAVRNIGVHGTGHMSLPIHRRRPRDLDHAGAAGHRR